MVECTLSVTHCLRLNLQLHTIDLVRTCRISSFCTVAWQLASFQLTRRIARSLGDSWASCNYHSKVLPALAWRQTDLRRSSTLILTLTHPLSFWSQGQCTGSATDNTSAGFGVDTWSRFYRAMLCIRGTSHGPVSVRLSVTSPSSTKTAKRRITQTTPHDSQGSLVFWSQRPPRNSTGVTPYGGAKCRWGGSKSATFDK